MSHAHMRHRIAAAGVLAAALTSVTACGGQGGAIALPTSGSPLALASTSAKPTPAPAGTPTDTTKAVQQALAAYRAAFADWAVVASMANKADYQNPRLADHMTGQALQQATGTIYIDTNVDQAVSKGSPILHPTVGKLIPPNSPTQVVVNDCVDTSSWLLWTSDNKHLYNDTPGGRRQTQSLVVYADGDWKVSQMYMQSVGSC